MFIDITLAVTPQILQRVQAGHRSAHSGHVGTHFDVMDKTFPLEYTRRSGLFFDVSGIRDRDIQVTDISMEAVQEGMFVGFYTGFMEETGYGTPAYFKDHPQLSEELIHALVRKQISIIGVDCAGIRRGKEHTPADQYCADYGVFVVENLCHLSSVLGACTVNTYPMNYVGWSGLPCRVIVEK